MHFFSSYKYPYSHHPAHSRVSHIFQHHFLSLVSVMQTQNKSSMDVGYGTEASAEGKKMVSSHKSHVCLRIVALVLTLTAAIVAGMDNQSKAISMQILPGLPPVNVTVQAKWHYLSAFVYFVVANAIACSHAAISLVLPFANKGGHNKMGLLIFVLDLLIVALLFSGIGAASAVGLIGLQGNSHVQWKEVCNDFGRFCHQAAIALVLSMFGAIAFLFMAVLAVSSLHKRLKY